MSEMAVFRDRDGTITEEMGHLKEPGKLRLISRSAEAIRLLNENRMLAIMVSNQSGVARGYFTEKTVKKTNKRLNELLAEKGAYLDGVYYCPHHPELGSPRYRKKCNCRKPKPGMLLKAAEKFNLALKKCYVIGDKVEDIKLAQNVGAKEILVLTGYGTQSKSKKINPDHTVKDLYRAVGWIIDEIK